MDFSLRACAASITQRMARVLRRVAAHFDGHLVGWRRPRGATSPRHGLTLVEPLRQELDGLVGLAAGAPPRCGDGAVDEALGHDFLRAPSPCS